MKQKDIDKITNQILNLNNDKEKVHEFLCACANAKSIVENKMNADMLKISMKAMMSNLFNQIGK